MESVKKVTDIVAEIAAASEEQSAGIEQVNNAVTQMDNVTQQNAALVEEASAASKAMEQQSSTLVAQIGYFRLGKRLGARTRSGSGDSGGDARAQRPRARGVIGTADALARRRALPVTRRQPRQRLAAVPAAAAPAAAKLSARQRR